MISPDDEGVLPAPYPVGPRGPEFEPAAFWGHGPERAARRPLVDGTLPRNDIISMPNLRFREDKATQAAARLLSHGGGSMNLLKLVKLLYLAEREALIRWGRPITMDILCSLPHGPVLSNVLNLINEEPDPEYPRYWHEVVSERKNYDVELIGEAISDHLSRVEVELLDETYKKYGRLTKWQLRDLTHKLPEWKDPGNSMLPIRIADILASGGYSKEEIEEIITELDHLSYVDQVLA